MNGLTFLLRMIRLLVILVVVAALTMQSWNVTIDYFAYTTSPSVVIKEFPPQITPPLLLFCARVHDVDLRMEGSLENIFSGTESVLKDSDNSWGVVDSEVPGETLNFTVKKFLRSSKYCIYAKVYNKFSKVNLHSPKLESRFVGLPFFYEIVIGTDPLFSNSTWKRTELGCRARLAYFQVAADEGDVYDPGNPYIVKLVCTEKVPTYRIEVSYTESLTRKLPAPYDTECVDYKTSKNDKSVTFLNRHDCYGQCLKIKSANWSLIPDVMVIERDKFNQSKMEIATIRLIDNEEKLKKMLEKKEEPGHNIKLLEKYNEFEKHWGKIEDRCEQECGKSDCVYKKIVPYVYYEEKEEPQNVSSGQSNPSNLTKLSKIYLMMRLPRNKVFEITFQPKQRFVDFFVYMVGGINFWLGVAAIQVNEIFDFFIQIGFKKRTDKQWKGFFKKFQVTKKVGKKWKKEIVKPEVPNGDLDINIIEKSLRRFMPPQNREVHHNGGYLGRTMVPSANQRIANPNPLSYFSYENQLNRRGDGY